MNYLSVQFAFFLVAAVLGFHLCPSRYRALFLLLASYAFYVLSSPLAAVGMVVATAFAFLFGFLARPALKPTVWTERPSRDGRCGCPTRILLESVQGS